jgi:feruloyl esterase
MTIGTVRFGIVSALALFVASAAAVAQRGQGPAAAMGPDEQQCAALTQMDLEKASAAPARVLSARLVDVATSPGGGRGVLAASPIKRYCQVNGYVAPQNKFEMRLPLPSEWNQRFFFSACAGFCGAVNGNACNPALARGYASATGNGGHDSSPGFDGLWAANAPNLQEDYAWRSNHVITVAAKAIATKYYGQPIARSYMSGCSKGGHAVLLEAQRFPEDFDGLLAIAPVYDLAGRASAGAWFAQAVSDGKGGSVLNPAAADAVHKSVLARCGAQAGVDEGLVTDPASCDWRPDMIACASEGSGADCLTPRQVDAVKRLMSPVKNSKGEVVYRYPYIPGTETEWAGWNFGGSVGSPEPLSEQGNYTVNEQFLRYLADATTRANVDPLTFNFDRDPATLARARKIYDATSQHLRAFKARGGKLLMWHGLADAGIMASSSVGYYEGVTKLMGGRQQTEEFFRLFLIPGVHHCFGGPGLVNFDAVSLLEKWVEKGEAPDVLIASRSANGVVERSRPIYPYPMLARYSGQGDPKQASSFAPFDPTRR